MTTPPSELDEPTRELLRQCLTDLQNQVAEQVEIPIRNSLGLTPDTIKAFLQSLISLRGKLQTTPLPNLDDNDLALLKTAIVQKLRAETARLEENIRLTPDRQTKDALEERVKSFRQLAELQWIQEREPSPPPRLSDYLVPAQIEKLFATRTSLPSPRERDEKFGILIAPGLFFPDLKHYRRNCCEFRNRPLVVAYLDIDNFKEFNKRYSEPRVDRELLPRFMRILEAMVYGLGHIYRYGGDEYLMLLPNCTRDDSVRLLIRLRTELVNAEYGTIDRRPTISVGLCEVTHDLPLTDQQIEQRAADAKAFAKSKGKNCIAGYSNNPPGDAVLTTLLTSQE